MNKFIEQLYDIFINDFDGSIIEKGVIDKNGVYFQLEYKCDSIVILSKLSSKVQKQGFGSDRLGELCDFFDNIEMSYILRAESKVIEDKKLRFVYYIPIGGNMNTKQAMEQNIENYTRKQLQKWNLSDWVFKWSRATKTAGICNYTHKTIKISKPLLHARGLRST